MIIELARAMSCLIQFRVCDRSLVTDAGYISWNIMTEIIVCFIFTKDFITTAVILIWTVNNVHNYILQSKQF